MRNNLGIVLVLLGALLAHISCSSKKPKGKTKAEVLYKEAQEMIEKERYLAANENLNLIKSQHPYSYYATPAELLQADILFKQENYPEAAAAYTLFRDFHPKHKRIHYVLYQIGESYFKQIPDTFDRDLSSAHDAIKFLSELKQRYPNSKHIKDANEKIARSKEMIYLKEKYIADFYFKTEKFEAAEFRYNKILKEFTNRSLLDHAKSRLVLTSYYLKNYRQCLNYIKKYSRNISSNYIQILEQKAEECGDELKKEVQEKQTGQSDV
jgi:outer membrane protein assembly factor BamD